MLAIVGSRTADVIVLIRASTTVNSDPMTGSLPLIAVAVFIVSKSLTVKTRRHKIPVYPYGETLGCHAFASSSLLVCDLARIIEE